MCYQYALKTPKAIASCQRSQALIKRTPPIFPIRRPWVRWLNSFFFTMYIFYITFKKFHPNEKYFPKLWKKHLNCTLFSFKLHIHKKRTVFLNNRHSSAQRVHIEFIDILSVALSNRSFLKRKFPIFHCSNFSVKQIGSYLMSWGLTSSLLLSLPSNKSARCMYYW